MCINLWRAKVLPPKETLICKKRPIKGTYNRNLCLKLVCAHIKPWRAKVILPKETKIFEKKPMKET